MSFAYDANCISTIFSVTIQLILPLYVIAACILINRLRSHIVLPPKHQPWRIEEEVDDDDATTQKKTISTVRVVHECVCRHELRIRRTHIDLPIQDVDVPHIASSLQLPGSRRRERWSEWVTVKKIHAKDRIIEQCCVFVVWMEWLNWCPEPYNERQSVSRGCCSNETTPLVCCHHHPCIMSWHGGLFQFPSPSFSWWRQERHVFYSTDIKRHPRNNIVLFYPHHRRDIRLAPEEHCAEESWQLLYEPNRTGHTHNMRIIGILQIGIIVKEWRKCCSVTSSGILHSTTGQYLLRLVMERKMHYNFIKLPVTHQLASNHRYSKWNPRCVNSLSCYSLFADTLILVSES